MEELNPFDAFDLLYTLLEGIKNHLCEEKEVYVYLLHKMRLARQKIDNNAESDSTLKMDIERTVYYTLVDFQKHIPVAKHQGLLRKLFCLSKREYPYDAIRVVLDKIMAEKTLTKQFPPEFHLRLLTKLRLSHVYLPITIFRRIKQLTELKKLKLAHIKVAEGTMVSVSDPWEDVFPPQLTSLNISGNELGRFFENSKKLFLNIWRLRNLFKLNISNNLIDNEFFINVCLYGIDETNTTLKRLIARANVLSTSSGLCTAENPPPNIFDAFGKAFECAQIDLAFNFIEDISEEVRASGKEASAVLLSHEDGCVESIIMPEYVISREKPLAIITHRKSHASVLVEKIVGQYLQIKIQHIDPVKNQDINAQGISSAEGETAWEFTSALREYVTHYYKKYSFSRHVLRSSDDIQTLSDEMNRVRPFNICACGTGKENCFTTCLKGFNATKENSSDRLKEWRGHPSFYLVRDRPSSINRYYFFTSHSSDSVMVTVPSTPLNI